MFLKFIDALIDKMLTQDFWRGLVYVLAGLGVTFSPEHAAVIISAALVISGVVHVVWHKQHPELPNEKK